MTHFKTPQRWADKVLDADSIWKQVKNALIERGLELPQTPRRPDIRLIVDNIDGVDRVFRNPANHANDKSEHIPARGESTAAMIMVAGDTLNEQYRNAKKLFDRFDLGNKGLSDEFLKAMQNDRAGGLIAEAYGPAPFAGQTAKLVRTDWKNASGSRSQIKPLSGPAASFGARPATTENVIHIGVPVYVRGTNTIAELVESSGMMIAVATDWQSGKETTRPIVASVAREFYGAHCGDIPDIIVHPDGHVGKIDLKNGTDPVDLYPDGRKPAQTRPSLR